MKLDRVFLKEFVKLLVIYSLLIGTTWAVIGFASLWGITGMGVLAAVCFVAGTAVVAGISAKQKRFSQRIKP